MILSYLNILFKYMSYFPILRDKNAKNGSEFYTKFLDSITTFGNTYFGTKIFRKDIVLVKDKPTPRRRLTPKEIDTFVKIYLLPKLYLFYSKIDYTFTSNIKGYYEYYYDSYNRFNILCKYYLNPENPVIRKINFDIYQKVKKDSKNKGNNTLEMLKKFKENNIKNVDILKILKTVLEKKISENDKKTKGLQKIDKNIEKIIDKLKRFNSLFDNIPNINTNNKPTKSLFDRINTMYDNLYSKNIDTKINTGILSIINNAERIYYEIIQIYSETIAIIKKYKFDSIKLDLNKLTEALLTDMKAIIASLLDKNIRINNSYKKYKTNINIILENIDKQNNNIEKFLLINENKNKQKLIIDELIKLKESINSISKEDITDLNTNKNKNYYKNYFYKLLYNIFIYIISSNSYEIFFLQKINAATLTTKFISVDYTIISKLSPIKDIEFDYNKILKEYENYLDENIENANEEEKNLKEEQKTFEAEIIEDVDTQIRTITTKIDENDKELRAYKTKIDKYKSDIDKLDKKTKAGITKDYTQLQFDDDTEKLGKLQSELTKETQAEESLKGQQKLLQSEKDELTKNKFKNSILFKKRKMNIDVITKLIALYGNISTVCQDLKKDDSLKPLTTEFESFNTYSIEKQKFIKEIKKENENTNSENNIVSCFKQNYLFLLFKNLKNSKELLKELLLTPLFFPKSKPLIRTNKNKDEKPFFNEDFIDTISKYIIGNDIFMDYLKGLNTNFKNIITKLLKENKKETKFNYLVSSINTKTNIEKIDNIIDKCIKDESEKYKDENRKNKIYPYTNFIIAYFALYLKIINLILGEINNSKAINNAIQRGIAKAHENSKKNNGNNNNSVLENKAKVEAATKIQSLFRGVKNRKKIKENKNKKNKAEASATKIQSLFRKNRNKKIVEKMKRNKER